MKVQFTEFEVHTFLSQLLSDLEIVCEKMEEMNDMINNKFVARQAPDVIAQLKAIQEASRLTGISFEKRQTIDRVLKLFEISNDEKIPFLKSNIVDEFISLEIENLKLKNPKNGN